MGIRKEAIHPPVDANFISIWVGHEVYLMTRDAGEAQNCVLRLFSNLSDPQEGLDKVFVVKPNGERLNGKEALYWAQTGGDRQ